MDAYITIARNMYGSCAYGIGGRFQQSFRPCFLNRKPKHRSSNSQILSTICWASSQQAALFDQIQRTGSSQELFRILLENEAYILSDDTTSYLYMAWEVLLHKHNSTIKADKDLQGFMMQHTMPLVHEFKPPEISMIARAMVATRTGAAADIVHISSDIQTRMVQFAPKELCMVMWALSSHPGMSEDEKHSLFKSLASLVKKGMGMGNFTAQDLSILVWSLGQAGFRDDVLLKAAEAESGVKIASFSTEDVSRLMHGFSCVGYNPHSLFVSITETYQDRLDQFSPQDLALFVVSLGKLVVEPPIGFTKSMIARAKDLVPAPTMRRGRNSDDMLTVHLNALILWSFARLGFKKTSFTTKSIKFISANVSQHDSEDLVAVLWACCRLDVKLVPGQVTEFSSRLLQLFSDHRDSDNPACLCRGFRYLSLLWSNTSLLKKKQGYTENASTDEMLLVQNVTSIIKELFGRSVFLDNVSSWDCASVIIALGGFSFLFENASLDAGVIRSIQNRVISLDVEATLLPRLAFTIAKLRLESPMVIESLSKIIVYKAGVIPLDGLVQIAYSYASFSVYNSKKQDVSRAISKRLVSNLGSLSSKDKARAAFAFFRLEKQQTSISRKLLESLDERDIASLEASSLYGLFITLSANSTPKLNKDFRHALIEATLEHVNSFTQKQLLAIKKILGDTRGASMSGQEANLEKLIRARTAILG